MTHNLDAIATGVLLSGMGADSTQGRLKSQQHRVNTRLRQDEQASVVRGIPGAADHVVPRDKVAKFASRLLRT